MTTFGPWKVWVSYVRLGLWLSTKDKCALIDDICYTSCGTVATDYLVIDGSKGTSMTGGGKSIMHWSTVEYTADVTGC